MGYLTRMIAVAAIGAVLAGCATAPPAAVIAPPPIEQQIAACGAIDDMIKDRLDCFDAIAVATPAPPGPSIVAVNCRAVAEQDARLLCFDKLLIVQAPPPKMPTYTRRSPPKRYVRHRRGGCGSRGGPGYRLPNGKCASWGR
jgi:hypothetical protein